MGEATLGAATHRDGPLLQRAHTRVTADFRGRLASLQKGLPTGSE